MSDTQENVQTDNTATDGKESTMSFSLANTGEEQDPTQHNMDAETTREGKYLTFSLADEEYGIGILKIKEIIGLMPITAVPRTPDYVRGVINLRGKVIPVMDVRTRFQLPSREHDERTCIMAGEAAGELEAAFDELARKTASDAEYRLDMFQRISLRLVGAAVAFSIAATLFGLLSI